jgi:cellulose synthase/poly-beta-1,6-N-acetylglucosamine synthase-like glycosyltransferase
MQLHLLLHYLFRNSKDEISVISSDILPIVTVQLPIFNEKYVVNRLIDKICDLDYPKDRLQIQILDDSTDETYDYTQQKVEEYKSKGFDIVMHHRTDRSGYKAGALKEATKSAKGEFIAIFDADFLPKEDFLLKTIGKFKDPKIGVVQTRWEHLNQNHSILTQLQAFQLNVHFTIEQKGREKADYLLQFNGTAGVWRKTTIDDAGGWHADTLTEDLDLSYRAQLKGWKIAFFEDITAPAELPAEMLGLKSQQYRWMKGGAETAKKLLPSIWKSDLPVIRKVHASVHLLASSVFLFIFCLGVFSIPLLYIMTKVEISQDFMSIFLISIIAITFIYYIANVRKAWPRENKLIMILKFIFIFPTFLALSMGLSFHNSVAVLSGLRGKKSAFVRTPKYGNQVKSNKFSSTSYFIKKLSFVTIFEGLLTLYFLFGLLLGYYLNSYSFILLHSFLFIGYGATFYYSVKAN